MGPWQPLGNCVRATRGIGQSTVSNRLARDTLKCDADPREYTSGSSVPKKTRISKAGNRHLRCALYMSDWCRDNWKSLSAAFEPFTPSGP